MSKEVAETAVEAHEFHAAELAAALPMQERAATNESQSSFEPR